jgi:bifunctional DNA-binding transcriptional regulator/antitoxin component of YhaV-PrlF toxin-antitoxin module
MKPVTTSTRYRILIPPEIRKEFKLKPGRQLAFIPYQGSLRLVLVPPIEEACGMLRGLNVEDIREEEDEVR